MFFKRQYSIDSFLASLNHWQKVNLYTVLMLGQNNISYREAKRQAIVSDDEKLSFLLRKSLNSPDPKM
ncbi:hypothetical protein FOL80_07330 [Lactobacillus reuteri]|uniref:hypothetical protein n=1 Tax=Limosilactobacillus reuteri TaxID=1598 RepID=UPI00146DE5F3|nr:hypothetical protein [Limosilactobacillus reuteri]NMV48544.1 hypothetical protein [Limosilactobacillus reuteri]NMV50245.1 hypothetical protein [Limosilactobacillus reuteri]NMV60212.1 hypothetical protein [Limosilactobacillus reuteri]NMV63786.1 hypothetical protein [Limosilactobacillus reuteri]NMV67378.1 hypothetical protein [Limosilactobacillus reuteri]